MATRPARSDLLLSTEDRQLHPLIVEGPLIQRAPGMSVAADVPSAVRARIPAVRRRRRVGIAHQIGRAIDIRGGQCPPYKLLGTLHGAHQRFAAPESRLNASTDPP